MAVSALLFDLDGTLIDSMPHHQTAWQEWHRRRQLPFEPDSFFTATAGRANAEIMRTLVPGRTADDYLAMADEKELLYREIAAHSLDLIEGFDALQAAARERGLKLAICTASTPENMALAFDRFGLDAHMDTVVSPADGLRGMPSGECVVFEDAPLGIEAARRAGMKAVALTTSLSPDDFMAYDNVLAIVPDLTRIDLAALLRCVADNKETPHA
jgi:HAD superfamily hydrolase (TIGR01509 family)